MLSFLRDALRVEVPEPLLEGVGVPPQMPRAASRVLDPGSLFDSGPPVTGGRLQGIRAQWAVAGSPWTVLRDLRDVVAPPSAWLDVRYPQVSAGWSRRRIHHLKTVAAWLTGRGVSPLSPNQEFEE